MTEKRNPFGEEDERKRIEEHIKREDRKVIALEQIAEHLQGILDHIKSAQMNRGP
jgi:hypothetical protein